MAFTMNYKLGKRTTDKSRTSNYESTRNSVNLGTTPAGGRFSAGPSAIAGDKHLSVPGKESPPPKIEKLTGTLKKKAKIVGPHDVMCLKFNRSGTALATGFANGLIELYDVTKSHPKVMKSIPATDVYPATSIRFFPSAVRHQGTDADLAMVTYVCGIVRFWDMSTGKMLSEIDELRRSKSTTSAAFSSTGEHLATVGGDSQIHLYDVKTSKRVSTLESSDVTEATEGHKGRNFAIQFDPTNPNVLISGGWDRIIQYWDRRNKSSFKKIFGPFICGDALDLDPRENKILSGSWRVDDSLEIWDYGTGKKLSDVVPDNNLTSKLYCCQWVGDDHIIAGGSSSNVARVINRQALVTTGSITNLAHSVYCLDSDHDPKVPCVAVGTHNLIYLLNVVVPDVMKKHH